MPEAWVEAALAERRRQRDGLIATARTFVDELSRSPDLVAAVVYGSVARGDFNAWSDVDVLVVVRHLPARLPERLAAFADRLPAGVQAIAWTPEEFSRAYRARNPIAREALSDGVVLHGRPALEALRDRD